MSNIIKINFKKRDVEKDNRQQHNKRVLNNYGIKTKGCKFQPLIPPSDSDDVIDLFGYPTDTPYLDVLDFLGGEL